MFFCLEYNREERQEAEERRVVEFFRLTTLPAIHYKKVCLFLLINIRPVFIIVIYLAIVISYYHLPKMSTFEPYSISSKKSQVVLELLATIEQKSLQ